MKKQPEFIPGHVTIASIRHDAWCPTLRTNRTTDCQCNPIVEYHDATEDLDGAVKLLVESEKERRKTIESES